MITNQPGPASPEDPWAVLFSYIHPAVAAMAPERRAEVEAAMERGHFRVVAGFVDLEDRATLRYVPQVLIPDHAARTATWTPLCEVPWDALPMVSADVIREHRAAVAHRDMDITPTSMGYGLPSA